MVAVEDLSFTARAGEVVGLLGPNGAGKTTAIRVLTTIFAPTAGSFAVAGVPHTRPAEIRQRIGVLPESAGYPEQQTGAEYLRYHARLFGHSRESARSDGRPRCSTRSAWPSASRRGSRPTAAGCASGSASPGRWSTSPQVVFFDEPTLGLDPAGQRQVLRLVEGIARERGATVVLSTHFLAEVEDTCARVLILNRGRVVAEGTVAEVTQRAAAPRRAPVPRAGRAARPRARHACRGAGAGRGRSRSTGVPTGWRQPAGRSPEPAARRGERGRAARWPTRVSRCSPSSSRARGSATRSWR